jgi:hypothetical protein
MTNARAHIGEKLVKKEVKQKQDVSPAPGTCSGLGSKKCSCFGGKKTCSRIGMKCEVLYLRKTAPVIVA